MSPEQPPGGEPPAEGPEDRVARLLGHVGAERPTVPPEVRARLDATLADLVREREAADSRRGGATDGSNHRRGRFLLAAAAAVIVVGAGGVTVAALSERSADTYASKAGGAASDNEAPGAPEASLPLKGGSGAGSDAAQAGSLPVVRPGHVASDVRALLRHDVRPAEKSHRQPPVPAVDCTAPAGVRSRQARTVLYGDTPASLVLRPGRVAEVWSCSGTARLVRVTISAP